ncbi:MAG: hypothetical protein PHY92_07785 [Alphaproteobacteria bacterium]|nr:hypothetical protein [Alphaproteobacteria bacterium]
MNEDTKKALLREAFTYIAGTIAQGEGALVKPRHTRDDAFPGYTAVYSACGITLGFVEEQKTGLEKTFTVFPDKCEALSLEPKQFTATSWHLALGENTLDDPIAKRPSGQNLELLGGHEESELIVALKNAAKELGLMDIISAAEIVNGRVYATSRTFTLNDLNP